MRVGINMLRVKKALRMIFLGFRIEAKRKSLEVLVLLCKTMSSEIVVRKNNELSKLGIKWMNLSKRSELPPKIIPFRQYNM